MKEDRVLRLVKQLHQFPQLVRLRELGGAHGDLAQCDAVAAANCLLPTVPALFHISAFEADDGSDPVRFDHLGEPTGGELGATIGSAGSYRADIAPEQTDVEQETEDRQAEPEGNGCTAAETTCPSGSRHTSTKASSVRAATRA